MAKRYAAALFSGYLTVQNCELRGRISDLRPLIWIYVRTALQSRPICVFKMRVDGSPDPSSREYITRFFGRFYFPLCSFELLFAKDVGLEHFKTCVALPATRSQSGFYAEVVEHFRPTPSVFGSHLREKHGRSPRL